MENSIACLDLSTFDEALRNIFFSYVSKVECRPYTYVGLKMEILAETPNTLGQILKNFKIFLLKGQKSISNEVSSTGV
jgi:hypothetical protein